MRQPKPGLLSRFRPRRYELGLAILDVGTDDFFSSERGVGANLEIARPLYGRGLALGYRARVQPTSSGFAGFGEVGAGLTFKLISVLAVAGIGGAGESAPFGLHYGGQADVLLPLSTYGGIEGSVTRAWCDEGDIWRFDGRFVVRTSLINPRVYTVGIGWETRVDSRIITINLGTLVVPGL